MMTLPPGCALGHPMVLALICPVKPMGSTRESARRTHRQSASLNLTRVTVGDTHPAAHERGRSVARDQATGTHAVAKLSSRQLHVDVAPFTPGSRLVPTSTDRPGRG